MMRHEVRLHPNTYYAGQDQATQDDIKAWVAYDSVPDLAVAGPFPDLQEAPLRHYRPPELAAAEALVTELVDVSLPLALPLSLVQALHLALRPLVREHRLPRRQDRAPRHAQLPGRSRAHPGLGLREARQLMEGTPHRAAPGQRAARAARGCSLPREGRHPVPRGRRPVLGPLRGRQPSPRRRTRILDALLQRLHVSQRLLLQTYPSLDLFQAGHLLQQHSADACLDLQQQLPSIGNSGKGAVPFGCFFCQALCTSHTYGITFPDAGACSDCTFERVQRFGQVGSHCV
mmetsp:Transcript_23700/g.74562  ORF Transcript_23700/g.74562 Transcript_23700/m.74562 type:complete len:288 (-) Transcript_23700:20-883(-)